MNIGGKIIIADETIVQALSDKDLDALANAIVEERRMRIDAKIKSNKYEKPTDSEIEIFRNTAVMDGSARIAAIKAYRDRNQCSIMEAKMVFDAL